MQSRKSLFKGGIGYADGFAGSEGNGRGENFVQSDQPSSGEASRSQLPNSEAMLESFNEIGRHIDLSWL
jgi:hypothetical protein